jgi:hypothetical protein
VIPTSRRGDRLGAAVGSGTVPTGVAQVGAFPRDWLMLRWAVRRKRQADLHRTARPVEGRHDRGAGRGVHHPSQGGLRVGALNG